jgi:nitrite reductase/ring-hydroxylating ferredoxin subunit
VLVRVGKATDVETGQLRVFQVEARPVTVANVGGRLYAFDDTCTHQGCSLAEGELEQSTVTCPCHGSQFDVTSGEVLRGPADEPVGSRAVEVQGLDLLVGT